MRTRLRSESGQVAALLPALLTVVLLGVAALAIDVGVWLTASRHTQGVADAAALAAVHDLPGDPAAAQADAVAYAATNGGTLDGAPAISGDTVTVKAKQTVPAYFAKLIGLGDVTVHASASAQGAGIGWVDGSGTGGGTGMPMPLAVSKAEWLADGLGKQVTLTYGPQGAVAGGQFGLVDFSQTGATIKASTIAGWVTGGYPGRLQPGTYPGVVGNRFSPPPLRNALPTLVGKTITLPIFSGTNGVNGANMTYTVVGWGAFQVSAVPSVGGALTQVTGKFVTLHVEQPGTQGEYFGVGHVKLTK